MVDLVFKDSEKKHKFHLVNPSPWPIVGAFSALFLVSGAILYMHYEMLWPMLAGLVLILFTMFMWWRDIIKESTFLKVHNSITEIGLRWGMALFITSEVMFFVAFFWAFFDASLLPKTFLAEYKEVFTGTLGIGVWPPKGIETFDPLDIPYLNTLILLLSGTTCTWAHHELREGNNKEALKGLYYTVPQHLIAQGVNLHRRGFQGRLGHQHCVPRLIGLTGQLCKASCQDQRRVDSAW